jgi:hypothetical protein
MYTPFVTLEKPCLILCSMSPFSDSLITILISYSYDMDV